MGGSHRGVVGLRRQVFVDVFQQGRHVLFVGFLALLFGFDFGEFQFFLTGFVREISHLGQPNPFASIPFLLLFILNSLILAGVNSVPRSFPGRVLCG